MIGGLNELALFAGAGGGILGGKLLGWRTVCAVEIEPYPVSVLIQRQNEGFLAPFPIWDDVCTFDGKPWQGIVDVVSGGFPCQDISVAGNRIGLSGTRSGLWKQFARIIGEVRPQFVFVENSDRLYKYLGTVLGDLALLGYDAEWGVFSACQIGAPHTRKRMFVLAYSNSLRCGTRGNSVSNASGLQNWQASQGKQKWEDVECWIRQTFQNGDWESPTQSFLGVDDELAARLDRIKAIGNGQVPIVAATAWGLLQNRIFSKITELSK